MQKHILFLMLLFFSTTQGMNEPEKRKLLFPVPNKTQQESLNAWWKSVGNNWHIYHRFGENFPQEINQRITYFLLKLNNPPSLSTSQDQFFRKMLLCCILFYRQEKSWKLPIKLDMTYDEKYYIERSENGFTIYDAKTKKCIRSIEEKYYLDICKKENLIICHDYADKDCSYKQHHLYEIANDRWHKLDGLHCDPILSCVQCIVGLDQEYLSVWSIINTNAISCYKIPCVNRKYSFVKIDSDNHVVFGPGDGTIRLLTVECDGLREIARYDAPLLLQSFTSELMHYNGSDYLILRKNFSIGIKIKKYNDNTIALKQIFALLCDAVSIVGKNTVLSWNSHQNILSIINYSGKIIQAIEIPAKAFFAKRSIPVETIQIFYEKQSSQSNDFVMTNVMHDNHGYGTCFAEKSIKNINNSPFSLTRNRTLYFLEQENKLSCFDSYGYELMFMRTKKFASHPLSNALLYEAADKSHRKYIFYPKHADDHLKQLAYKPLKLAQLAGLEKLCDLQVR